MANPNEAVPSTSQEPQPSTSQQISDLHQQNHHHQLHQQQNASHVVNSPQYILPEINPNMSAGQIYPTQMPLPNAQQESCMVSSVDAKYPDEQNCGQTQMEQHYREKRLLERHHNLHIRQLQDMQNQQSHPQTGANYAFSHYHHPHQQYNHTASSLIQSPAHLYDTSNHIFNHDMQGLSLHNNFNHHFDMMHHHQHHQAAAAAQSYHQHEQHLTNNGSTSLHNTSHHNASSTEQLHSGAPELLDQSTDSSNCPPKPRSSLLKQDSSAIVKAEISE